MTREEQSRFLSDILDVIERGLTEKLHQLPEEWDGIEIRQWVHDWVAGHINYRSPDRARLRRYRNEVLTRNLI